MAIAAVMLGGMGTVMAGSLAMQGYGMAKGAPDMPKIEFPKLFGMDQTDDAGKKAADKRRSMYSGMGRSSTILTGPGGLSDKSTSVVGASDPSQPKLLLGL